MTEKAKELIETFGKELAIKVAEEIMELCKDYCCRTSRAVEEIDRERFNEWEKIKKEIKQN